MRSSVPTLLAEVTRSRAGKPSFDVAFTAAVAVLASVDMVLY